MTHRSKENLEFKDLNFKLGKTQIEHGKFSPQVNAIWETLLFGRFSTVEFLRQNNL